MASQSRTQTRTIEQQQQMDETLTLVLTFKDMIDSGDAPTEADQEELVRHFSDIAGLLSAGVVIAGEVLITLGHILEMADLIKYGFDMGLIGAPLMALHLFLRFWILNKVAQSVEVSESKLDSWHDQYQGPHGELNTAHRQARNTIDRLAAAVKTLLQTAEGSVEISVSMELRTAIIQTERAIGNYSKVIEQSQKDLKVVLLHTQDSKARTTSLRTQGFAGMATSTAVVVVSGAAVVATGGLAAVVGLAVGGAGLVGNAVAVGRCGSLLSRTEDVLKQIDQNQAVIQSHRDVHQRMVEEVKRELEKTEDTIRREKGFLVQRRKAEVAEEQRQQAETKSNQLLAANAAKDAELERLRRMVAGLQASGGGSEE